jgi:hypothetical protein
MIYLRYVVIIFDETGDFQAAGQPTEPLPFSGGFVRTHPPEKGKIAIQAHV